ncbi:MAG: CapA family protein [Butyrivibrio sp.]|nr:CapA family protein [Butyrivibrio sp.]
MFLKVPMGVDWQQKKQEIYGGKLQLSGKKMVLRDGVKGPKWHTKKNWLVQDFLVSDIDGDEDLELILLVWKRGRFGPDMPFWVKADEKSYSQHIFIYDISEDLQVKEKWLASEIGQEVTRFKLMEKNPSIILTEEKSGHCSLWRWESWGLKNMDSTVSLVAFGDNIIHDSILDYGMKAKAGDFSFLYEPFLQDIEDADIAVLNAETPLVDKASAYGGYPSFGSPIEVGEAIAGAGFDVVACANNHCLDRGIYGIDVTESFYRSKGLTWLGIRSPSDSVIEDYKTISRNGMTFALFNYTYGTNEIDGNEKFPGIVDYLPEDEAGEKELSATLKEAKKAADIVIVFVHWGDEYSAEVSAQQEHFTDLFANSGVDVVIGSHPHVLQKSCEVDRPDGRKMLVYYSLGNFRADQGKDESTKIGGEARIVFEYDFDGVRIAAHDLKQINSYWK